MVLGTEELGDRKGRHEIARAEGRDEAPELMEQGPEGNPPAAIGDELPEAVEVARGGATGARGRILRGDARGAFGDRSFLVGMEVVGVLGKKFLDLVVREARDPFFRGRGAHDEEGEGILIGRDELAGSDLPLLEEVEEGRRNLLRGRPGGLEIGKVGGHLPFVGEAVGNLGLLFFVVIVPILVEMEAKPVPKVGMPESDADVLGVDMGIKTLATCSDGTSYGNGKHLEKSQKRLKKEQRKLSRKKKGSNNRKKQRIKVAKIHQRIANQRQDAIEKATAEIAGKSHAAVAVENLNVKGMVKNHHLAKSVSDASMSAFLTRLETKCRNKGKTFVKVDRWFPSSQTCSVCGHVNKGIRDLKIREWVCPRCHTRHERDNNASINIAREGYRLIARLPMDGGEVTPVEKTALQQDNQGPAVTDFAEAGRVLEREATCL